MGNALRFGNYAVIYATLLSNSDFKLIEVEESTLAVLSKWQEYEKFIITQEHNLKYFKEVENSGNEKIIETNYTGYYRGTTLNSDLYKFFKKN